jgi:hypothetical protein
LTAENAALREEIARLKGLKCRPSIKASGMTKPPKLERLPLLHGKPVLLARVRKFVEVASATP